LHCYRQYFLTLGGLFKSDHLPEKCHCKIGMILMKITWSPMVGMFEKSAASFDSL